MNSGFSAGVRLVDMMQEMDRERFVELIGKINAQTATAAEIREADGLYMDFEQKPGYTAELDERQREAYKEMVYGGILARINSPVPLERPALQRSIWARISIAASLLLGLTTGAYFLLRQQPPHQTAQVQQHDIAAGIQQATLTLANGQKIVLHKGLSGKLAQQGNIQILVNSGQAIAYRAAPSDKPAQLTYNTLSTKIGEQSPYPLVLADGTRIWLNAASSVTFPTAFSGKERVVTITGEALLEVAHNARQPFKVNVNGETIEDIGTVFNINAYQAEPVMKTTLVEGSIRIVNDRKRIILKPGQQAVRDNATSLIKVANDVNTKVVTAWKDGYFRFDLETLPVIMREFARWYNVEVVYEGQPTDQQFNMKVSRSAGLSQALQILANGGVKYRLVGRTLTIIP